MSWNVPSGSFLLIVIGRMLESNSFKAMLIGLEPPSDTSTSMGAPMDICRALAPTTLAFSKRVIFGGPIVILALADVFYYSPIPGYPPPGMPPGPPPGGVGGVLIFPAAITSSIFSNIVDASVADFTICFLTANGSNTPALDIS